MLTHRMRPLYAKQQCVHCSKMLLKICLERFIYLSAQHWELKSNVSAHNETTKLGFSSVCVYEAVMSKTCRALNSYNERLLPVYVNKRHTIDADVPVELGLANGRQLPVRVRSALPLLPPVPELTAPIPAASTAAFTQQ